MCNSNSHEDGSTPSIRNAERKSNETNISVNIFTIVLYYALNSLLKRRLLGYSRYKLWSLGYIHGIRATLADKACYPSWINRWSVEIDRFKVDSFPRKFYSEKVRLFLWSRIYKYFHVRSKGSKPETNIHTEGRVFEMSCTFSPLCTASIDIDIIFFSPLYSIIFLIANVSLLYTCVYE